MGQQLLPRFREMKTLPIISFFLLFFFSLGFGQDMMTTEGHGTLSQGAIDSAQHINVGDCSGHGCGGHLGGGGHGHGGGHGGGGSWGGLWGGSGGSLIFPGHGNHHTQWPSWPPRGWVYRGNGWWCTQCRVRWSSTSCWGWGQPHRRVIRPCEGVGRCTGNCASCTPWNRCTDRVRYRSEHH